MHFRWYFSHFCCINFPFCFGGYPHASHAVFAVFPDLHGKNFDLGWLRGGLSIALALSLPAGDVRDLIVSVTHTVVIFSISVQGLTIGKLLEKAKSSLQDSDNQ